MADSASARSSPSLSSRKHTGDPPRDGPVLFDCDGLLLDTETCWTRAESALFARYGRAFSPEHKQALIGTSLSSAGHILERLLDQPHRGDELTAELYELVTAELARGAEPLPGAISLVHALRGRRPLGVVSNTPRTLLVSLLTQAALTDSFEVVIGGDDVTNPKPAPDLYLRAAAIAPRRTGGEHRAGRFADWSRFRTGRRHVCDRHTIPAIDRARRRPARSVSGAPGCLERAASALPVYMRWHTKTTTS